MASRDNAGLIGRLKPRTLKELSPNIHGLGASPKCAWEANPSRSLSWTTVTPKFHESKQVDFSGLHVRWVPDRGPGWGWGACPYTPGGPDTLHKGRQPAHGCGAYKPFPIATYSSGQTVALAFGFTQIWGADA